MDGKGAGNRIAILLQGQADGKREGDPCRRSHIPVECCGVQAGAGYRKNRCCRPYGKCQCRIPLNSGQIPGQCCCCLARRGWSRPEKSAEGEEPPAGPVAPVAPVAPVGPAGPVAPAAPAAPVAPVGPAGPVGPVGPVAQQRLHAPVGPAGPVAPVAPVGPVEPFIYAQH